MLGRQDVPVLQYPMPGNPRVGAEEGIAMLREIWPALAA
jgi:hypothetical protein